MELTSEQEQILYTIKQSTCNLLKISAVAGAGKTATLVSIAKELPITHGLYLAFNKSIAEEAKLKFPYYIECRTLHSLAFTFVVKGTKRTINDFTPACITEDLDYDSKQFIIDKVDQFFTSSSLDLDYFDKHLPTSLASIAKHYVTEMSDGNIPCTFNFLLKMFHYDLANDHLVLPEYDILMLDEAGDTTGVSLEIFKLIKAKKKVMVGDPDQNIYTFMNTINGFDMLKNEGVLLTLSQSFRVSVEIAKRVEHFCKSYFNSKMKFTGTTMTDTTVNSIAYLARTNAGLISRMMKLTDTATPFNLLRTVDEIFDLPLFLLKLNPKMKYPPHKFKYIFNEYKLYLQDKTLQLEYKSHYSYLTSILNNDIQLKAAITLIRTHGGERIISTYNAVRVMPKRKSPITLATVHVAKGREWDEVYIEDDMNNCVRNIVGRDLDENAVTELRLAYVACTRGRVQLSNCQFL